jgi:hypothetical protein
LIAFKLKRRKITFLSFVLVIVNINIKENFFVVVFDNALSTGIEPVFSP